MKVTEELIKRIKTVRLDYGFSREKIAQMSDMASITLLRIESGQTKNIRSTSFEKITKALDICENAKMPIE